MNRRHLLAAIGASLATVLCVAGAALAQPPDTGDPPPKVTATLSNITRVETWSYFRPRPEFFNTPFGGGRPDYTFVGDRFRLGVGVVGARFDAAAAFDYVRLENLPVDAIGPGGLGTGAFYFAAAGVPYSYQLYLRELTLRVKSRSRGIVATLGRMSADVGAEAASAADPMHALIRDRIDGRLIGDFEWSYYQRRFDGVRVDVRRPRWQLASSAVVPTQGGFEESANLSMPAVQVVSGELTMRRRPNPAPANRALQVFGHVYRDRRPVAGRPDNSGLAARAVNVSVATLGGSYLTVARVGPGDVDTVAWSAVQFGNWYGQTQRAASVAAEGGYRWPRSTWRPWIRGGYWWASGDGDPRDSRHGTFFQMLPSSRKYALSSTYAQMNLRDLFLQAIVEPGRGVKARVETHRLDLANAADRWYQGSGATSSTGRFFGFASLPSSGATSLGTVVEGALDVPILQHWSMNGYLGTLRGGDVVTRLFATNRLAFWYIESRIAF